MPFPAGGCPLRPFAAFRDIDATVGSRPRSKGMERRDLLAANAEIFKVQGSTRRRARTPRRFVVGNPGRIPNAASSPAYCPRVSSGEHQLDDFFDLIITVQWAAARATVWRNRARHCLGNHSPTMFADWRFATAKGRSVPELIG